MEQMPEAAKQPPTHPRSPAPAPTDAPRNILKYLVHQFAKVLPKNMDARKAFVTSGGLKKIQEIQAEDGSKLREYVDQINVCYPEEIVRYYSPNYAQGLLDKLDGYQP